MRKFSKVVLITAAVLGVAGIGLFAGGAAMGADISEMDLQQYYQGPRIRILERLLDWEEDDWDEDDRDEVHRQEEPERYAARSETDFSSGSEKTDSEIYTLEVPSEMEIDLSYDELIFREYDGEKIQAEVTGDEDGNVKIYTEDDELKIKSQKKVKGRRIVIFCPPDARFRKIGVNVDAGAVSVENSLEAEDLSISVGAGTFSNTSSVKATDVEAEVGAGTLTLKGLNAQKVKAECGLGTMRLEVEGSETDYSYRLSCGAGNIKLGDGEYSGLGAVKKIDSPDASRKMQLQCGMGTVNVSFGG